MSTLQIHDNYRNKQVASRPISNILFGDKCRRDFPRTYDATSGQSFEIELTAHGRVGSAGVRNIVAVKRHHVTEHVRASAVI